MPSVNSKMATESDPINDEETAQTVNVIDRLNKENAATEQERDAALSELRASPCPSGRSHSRPR